MGPLPTSITLTFLLMAGLGCRNASTGAADRAHDAGGTGVRCATNADCGGLGTCIAGICRSASSCGGDPDCAGDGLVCHVQRFFCVECDGRSGQCPPGMGCQFDFTCAAAGGPGDPGCAGSCGGRSDCRDDQICREGQCCAPPSRCRASEDCPAGAPECNGATGQCFGGDGCFSDVECAEKPGCSAGQCMCDVAGGAPGSCVLRPDACETDADCWESGRFAQKVCLTESAPRRCADAPACGADATCRASGLVCDLDAGSPSFGFCQNGTPCPAGAADCTGDMVCDAGVCRAPNCLNTPSRCTSAEICDPATLICTPRQGGGCATDDDCQAGFYCNALVGMCEVGCRDSAECAPGICNAQHECEFPAGQFCGPCSNDADCPGNGRCVDLGIGRVCVELCSELFNIPCSDPTQECLLTFCNCL